jgi:MFS superfamily sulfate permease-like transporter
MVNAEPGKLAEPGLVVYWFGADLYYANANYFAEQVQTLVTKVQVPVHWLVLDAGAITAIDCSAGSTLRELQQELAATGVSLALAHVNAGLRAELDRQELSEVIGTNRLFDTLRDCLGAYHATNLGQDSKTIARAD